MPRKKDDIINDLQEQLKELSNSVTSFRLLAETYKRHQYLLLEMFANELITEFGELKTFSSKFAIDTIYKKKKDYLRPVEMSRGIYFK